MRIGELAGIVGVSTRTVRHYHRIGLLPEPERLANGYREYRLSDAVALARVRRMTEVGLSLDEVRAVLAEDRTRELREVLLELDADLARQQAAIGARRERLAAMLAQADLHPDSAVSPELAAVLRDFPTGASKFAAFDRDMLMLVYTAADPADRDNLLRMLRPLAEPEALVRGHGLYARLDELADAASDDARVDPLAADLIAHIPTEMATLMTANLDTDVEPHREPHPDRNADSVRQVDAILAEMSPAQAEVFRRLVIMLKEKKKEEEAT